MSVGLPAQRSLMNVPGNTGLSLTTAVLTLCLCIGVVSVSSAETRVYRWKDAAGVSHYGDAIPPEHADAGHTVLNRHGVEVERVAGAQTPEEIDEALRRATLAEQARRDMEAATLRDKVLLSTYLSVEEIESLRDQRLEMLGGQMRMSQRYLDNLRQKMLKLEREAQRYSPYSLNPDAKPIDGALARELSETLQSINRYEKNLSRSREEQRQLEEKFAADIVRFRELRGLSRNR